MTFLFCSSILHYMKAIRQVLGSWIWFQPSWGRICIWVRTGSFWFFLSVVMYLLSKIVRPHLWRPLVLLYGRQVWLATPCRFVPSQRRTIFIQNCPGRRQRALLTRKTMYVAKSACITSLWVIFFSFTVLCLVVLCFPFLCRSPLSYKQSHELYNLGSLAVTGSSVHIFLELVLTAFVSS